MDQLVELLKQIQDLAGVAIDALTEAAGGGKNGPPPEGGKGGPPPEGGEGRPAEPPREGGEGGPRPPKE